MVNEELIKRVVKQIEATPDEWDQEDWRKVTKCGTVACVAGWTLLLTGRMNAKGEVLDEQGALLPCKFGGTFYDEHPAGCQCSVSNVAEELLGLTDHQADLIFLWYPNLLDSLDRVEQLKDRIAEVTGVVFD